MTVLGIDEAICQIFGRERGRLRAAGILVGDFDLLIGATALRYNLTLGRTLTRWSASAMALRQKACTGLEEGGCDLARPMSIPCAVST